MFRFAQHDKKMQRGESTRHPLLALTLYSQSAFPFQQSRVRVIKAAVERVWREIAQVVFGQFAERLNQRLRLSHRDTGKCVRLVFETARPDVNQRRKPKADCPRQHREQQYGGEEKCGGQNPPLRENKKRERERGAEGKRGEVGGRRVL